MPPSLAAALYSLAIAGLLYLNRDTQYRTTYSLWLPSIWFLVSSSRSIAGWLQLYPSGQSGPAELEGSPADRTVLAILLAGGLIIIAGRGRAVIELLKANLPIVAFITFAALSIIWSEYPISAAKRWLRGLGDIVMVLIILTDRQPSNAIRLVLARVGLILLPLSMLLIKYVPDMGRAYTSYSGAPMWTGVTDHKSSLGQTCMIYGLAAVSAILTRSPGESLWYKNKRFVPPLVTISLAAYLLWFCDSKTSMVCFLLGAVLMALIRLWPLASRPFLLRSTVLAMVSIPPLLLLSGASEKVVEILGRDPSLTGRTATWDVMLRLADNHWIGSGYESFLTPLKKEAMEAELGVAYNAHNGYLDIYVNLGVIGLCILAWVLHDSFVKTTSRLKVDQDISPLLLSFFVIAVIYNLTEASYKMMSTVWLALLLATMAQSKIPNNRHIHSISQCRRQAESIYTWFTYHLHSTSTNNLRGAFRPRDVILSDLVNRNTTDIRAELK